MLSKVLAQAVNIPPSMTKRITMKQARSLVGYSVFHRGEHGEIVAARMMAEPMLLVKFGERQAILKVTELGAR